MFTLEAFWYVLCATVGREHAFFYFSLGVAWLYVHPIWLTFTILVIIQKKLLIGKFRPGPLKWNHWHEFRHWLHARMVESHEFDEVCNLWVNTEALSFIYRALGTKVG